MRLSEAPSHGKPVILYDVQSKGAQGYLSLAREILDGAAPGGSPRDAASVMSVGSASRNVGRSGEGSTRSSPRLRPRLR